MLGEPAEGRTRYAPGQLGAVASESTICSDIGIELLKQGGNAADAVGAETGEGDMRPYTDC